MLVWEVIMLLQNPNYLFIPLIIFFVKIGEISFETLRIIFISRNLKIYASIIYFVEVLIWLGCFGYTINHIKSNPLCAVAYALGGAIGTYLGLYLGNLKQSLNKEK